MKMSRRNNKIITNDSKGVKTSQVLGANFEFDGSFFIQNIQ
jgi:hypothetical protein